MSEHLPGRSMWVALDWIERHCVVPDGFLRGQPFRLYHFQGRYLQHFYMVRPDAQWVPEHPVLAPAFTYRRGLLVGPQKVGKNPLVAAQICLEGVGPALFAGWAGRDEGYACADHGCHCGWQYAYEPGEPMGMPWPTPLIQITAFSEDSTGNTYDALRPMIELGPLGDLMRTGEEFIRLPGGGLIDTVTSSNQSRLGQRITFAPQDELGLWTRLNRMEKVADTQYRNLAGMGGRATLTTNAWDPAENSVAQREYESSAEDVYRQMEQAPRNLSFGDKQERRRMLRIVYPEDTRRDHQPPGHVDLDAIEAEAMDLLSKDPAQARRFFGNELVAGAGAAVDPLRWDELALPDREVEPGTPVGLGFDGSVSHDATYLRACTAEGHGFTLGVWERPRGSAMLAWQAAHPGQEWSVPRHEVHEAIASAFGRFRVGKMYCDPWWWRSEIGEWQALYGEEVVLVLDTNSPRRMAPEVDRWRSAIREGTHTHDGDPTTAEHVKAAHLKRVHLSGDDHDGRTPYMLVKGADGRQIDGAIADVLALAAAASMPEVEAEPPVWVMVR